MSKAPSSYVTAYDGAQSESTSKFAGLSKNSHHTERDAYPRSQAETARFGPPIQLIAGRRRSTNSPNMPVASRTNVEGSGTLVGPVTEI